MNTAMKTTLGILVAASLFGWTPAVAGDPGADGCSCLRSPARAAHATSVGCASTYDDPTWPSGVEQAPAILASASADSAALLRADPTWLDVPAEVSHIALDTYRADGAASGEIAGDGPPLETRAFAHASVRLPCDLVASR